jgi:asparagine synthase (glutamine-hydrolysing)
MQRRDKMGFPVPLKEWFGGELRGMMKDIFSVQKRRKREFFDTDAIVAGLDKGGRFSRKTWGLMSLELWHQLFHDRAADYRRMLDEVETAPIAAQ